MTKGAIYFDGLIKQVEDDRMPEKTPLVSSEVEFARERAEYEMRIYFLENKIRMLEEGLGPSNHDYDAAHRELIEIKSSSLFRLRQALRKMPQPIKFVIGVSVHWILKIGRVLKSLVSGS